MRILLLILLLLSAFAGSADSGEAALARRAPNIVVLLADDLGWGDVGFNGRKQWKTPNLDRLARQGTRFSRWYTAGVVCAPSRAALVTGRYGIHNGVSGNSDDLPASETTVAEALRDRGYRTALFGKWHHGRTRPGATTYVHPMDHGFEEFFGFTNAVHAWEHFPKQLWEGREMKPVSGHADTLFVDRGVDFIRRNRTRPFFLYLPFIATHFHVEAPDEDVKQHLGKFEEKDPAQPTNARYAAMVTRLDKEVGRVLKALEDVNLEKDTLVVFLSDHGATFEAGNKGASNYHDSNGPFRGQKRTLWEGGIRVPAVVRWPGRVPENRTVEIPVHSTDLMPTLLAAAGAPRNAALKLDGADLLPLWTEGVQPAPRTLFWEWRAENYYQLAAMRGDKKLVITGSTPPELFDVVADPGERRSLAPEFPELTKSLRDELTQWLETESEASRWGKEPRKP